MAIDVIIYIYSSFYCRLCKSNVLSVARRYGKCSMLWIVSSNFKEDRVLTLSVKQNTVHIRFKIAFHWLCSVNI